MKTNLFFQQIRVLLGSALCWWCAGFGALQADDPQPVILDVQLVATNVVVTVRVPAGLQKIMIEGRARLDRGAWVPRVVQRLPERQGGVMKFTLPQSSQVETLRVRADREEALPLLAYKDAGVYAPSTAAQAGRFTDPNLPEVAGPGGNDGGDSRAVVESDIWKRDGQRLYFFNQYRGLQVIDLSQPDQPQLRGQLSVPAAGDQLYLLDSAHLLLLARNDCSYGVTGPASEVLLVTVTNAAMPVVSARLDAGGSVLESRLVGTALYLATQSYRQHTNVTGEITWEYGTTVRSYDFADPALPVARDTLWFPGWGQVIQATDRFLFVGHASPTGGWSTDLEIVDISDEHGVMQACARLAVPGVLADKFKINLNGDVLTVISYSWMEPRRWVTQLETYSLQTPTAPRALGRLELAVGEQLHATRFDGERVYVVTFLRMDPLWVVDLSDPARPRVAGELQVPGWSTYIEPLGDRLVSIGIDPTNGWRVAVSLFDVRDPARPALFDKVLLGENYSWSEANYDEKAFSVWPSEGLIMLPFQGYLTNGVANRIQLIDLGATNLVLRGQIQHSFQPRRSTLFQNRIYSISGAELIAVDAADRAQPQVRATVALAWPVDRSVLTAQHLLQVTDGSSSGWWSWNEAPAPVIRVSSVSQPEQILGVWTPTLTWPIVGMTRQGDSLWILQGRRSDWTSSGGQDDPDFPANGPTNIVATRLDLTQLPALPVVSRVGRVVKGLEWGAQFEPIWPAASLVGWVEMAGSYGWLDVLGPGVDGPIGVRPPPLWRPWWGSSYTGRMLTFDTAGESWLAEVGPIGDENTWAHSAFVAVEGKAFGSHTSYEWITQVVDGYTNYIWAGHSWLDVVDLADPANPTIRPPAPMPSGLVGVASHGEVVFTRGENTWVPADGKGQEWLAALAYDGVALHLVDAFALNANWNSPLAVVEGTVYLARPLGTPAVNTLEAWQLATATGKFKLLSSSPADPNGYSLRSLGSYLSLSDGGTRSFQLYDVTDPSAPAIWLKGSLPGCVSGTMDHADVRPGVGLALPLGAYGVQIYPR